MDNIQDKIMQANGIDHKNVSDAKLKGIQDLMKREKRRLWIVKLLTGLFWILSLLVLGAYIVAGKMFRHSQLSGRDSVEELVGFIVVMETLLPLIVIVAAVCTVFLYIRAKTINLLQVHERLGNLEEMVKVLLSK